MWKLLRSRGRVRAPRSGEAEIAGWCRGGVRALGSGEAEFVVFWGQAQVRALGRARRRSSSSGAEPKSEPWVGRGGDRRLLGLSPSPSPGSGGVRHLPGLSPSPSLGSGGVRRLPGLSPSPSPGSGERSFLWCLWQGLTACQFHSVKWHCSWSGAGGAVLLSGRLVERRSDGGHFGSAGGRASG